MSLLVSFLNRFEFVQNFEFHVGQTPLSSIYWPLSVIICYCIGIPSLQYLISKNPWLSPNLKYILVVHNLFLCVLSFCLLASLLTVLTNIYRSAHNEYTALDIYCNLSHYDQKGALSFLYFLNYVTKYYELLDTVFLALKQKRINFLHAYHHPATLLLTYVQILDSTGMQWVIIALNLFVHTVMYFYYFVCAAQLQRLFRTRKWKKLVTIFQIAQFVIDLISCYIVCALVLYANTCVGTARSGVLGTFILTSYLWLFIGFFDTAYNTKAESKTDDGQKNKNTKKKKKGKPPIVLILFVCALLIFMVYVLGVREWHEHMLQKLGFSIFYFAW